MPNPPRSTNNSLSAGLRSEELPVSSPAPLVVSTASSGPVAPLAVDSIAEAVVRALGNALPTIISSIQGNAPSQLNSSVPSASVGVSPSSSSGLSAVPVLPTFRLGRRQVRLLCLLLFLLFLPCQPSLTQTRPASGPPSLLHSRVSVSPVACQT